MLFLELYFNHKPVPLHELYEKAMRKHRCRSPACVLPHPAFSWYNECIWQEMEAVTIKRITEEELAKELRIQYIQNPPEGMTSDEVRDMSDEDLLDMDYFLHEFDDIDDDDLGEEGFYIF